MSAERLSLAGRICTRFLFVYAALFALSNSVVAQIPGLEGAYARFTALWHPLVYAFAHHILGVPGEIPLESGGISNSRYGLLFAGTSLAVAALFALLASLAVRRRALDVRLAAWTQVLLRLVVGSALIHYGMIKLVPTQMIAPPPPGVLLFRLGDLRPNYLLWWFMGASPTFESITGCAELLGGVLLFLPRTTLLGALLCSADMATVFMLNLCYDVQVKLYSFHLLAFSLLLVLPHRQRLATLFLWNRAVAAPVPRPVSRRPAVERLVQRLLLTFGLFILLLSVRETRARAAKLYPPRSPFYGAWTVEAFALAGRDLTSPRDPSAWRFVTCARPGSFWVERRDGGSLGYRADADPALGTLELRRLPGTQGADRQGARGPVSPVTPGETGRFTLRRPADDLLLLDGSFDGQPACLRLRKVALLR